MIDDVDRLDDALEGRSFASLPDPVGELVGVAAEVARVLAVPLLDAADRERLYLRVIRPLGWQDRLRHELPRLARRPTVVGVGAGAAVTLAVVGIALLRGRSRSPLGAVA